MFVQGYTEHGKLGCRLCVPAVSHLASCPSRGPSPLVPCGFWWLRLLCPLAGLAQRPASRGLASIYFLAPALNQADTEAWGPAFGWQRKCSYP